jgi:nucleotide-binding universal stress UspA family protein
MRKHVLFATDGSEFSEGAQQIALRVVKRWDAQLTAMTIVLTMDDLESVGVQDLRKQQEREAQARLDAVVAAAQAEGLSCETELRYGREPHQEIITTAAEQNVDMIVLGRRGRRGLARFFVGHATAQVAGRAHCNVLVVPRAAEFWSKRILLATDGSEFSQRATDVAVQIAGQCKLPVTVVSSTLHSHSAERKAEAQATVDQVIATLDKAGVSCEGLCPEGRADRVVVETAANRDADLIVVGSHGRTGLVRMWLGSISERIIGQATCPILVARKPM